MRNLLRRLWPRKEFSSKNFWEQRYNKGGDSGDGSYGRLSHFKATVINDLLSSKNIESVIELGCGDGHQLSLINYSDYIGLDISPSAIKICNEKFTNDETKKFYVFENKTISRLDSADLAISLDVIYHLVEEEVYQDYLLHLFSLSEKFVLIYSTNYEDREADHIVHRTFTDFVSKQLEGWELDNVLENPYPGKGDQESLANFYLFTKTSAL